MAAWGYALAAGLGPVLGLSLRPVGMLYPFGGPTLTTLNTGNLCRQVRSTFFVAPTAAVAARIAAFVVANDRDCDWPTEQAVVAPPCALLVVTWGVRWFCHHWRRAA